MEKFTRNQRISIITKVLMENPNKIVNLNTFTQMFNAAKSTVSEDLFIIKDILNKLSLGRIDTISGAAGGVKYVSGISKEESKKFAENLCINLKNKDRIIPGNFLYVTDIMCNPQIVQKAANILFSFFSEKHIDHVITMETKGIPLAYEVAKLLGVELVIVRRNNKLTEGSTLSINYVSGSSGRVQNMYVSKNSIKPKSKCIFIDDFMKAGGTALGITNLLKEFESELLGIGVLIDNTDIQEKLVNDYFSIVDFKGFDDNNEILVEPSSLFEI